VLNSNFIDFFDNYCYHKYFKLNYAPIGLRKIIIKIRDAHSMAEITPKPEVRGVMNRMRQQTHIVLWLLVFAFMGTIIFDWGMDLLGVKSPTQKGILGKVNGQEINYQTFFRMMQNEYVRLQQYGITPDNQQIRTLRENLWNSMVNEILVNQVVGKLGIQATDDEIVQEVRFNPPPEIRSAPDLQKPDGGFDQAKYDAALQTQTNLAVALEEQARSTIPVRKLQNYILSSVRVTESEIRQTYMENEITLTADYIFAEADRYRDADITVSEQEITNYYRDHLSDFFQSETRQLRYVIFDTTPTKEDSAAVNNTIAEALKRAQSGEDFTALAQEYTDTDGSFGTVAKGSLAPEYEEALFDKNNKPGSVIGPVQSGYGESIFKIERIIKKGSEIDSVDARHILFKYVASDNTLDNAESRARYFSQVAEDEGLDQPAAQENLTILETLPLNRAGFVPGFGSIPEIVNFAFYSDYDENDKPISSAIETPMGYAVFELAKVTEEHTKPLEEVRDEIEAIIREQKQLKMVQDLMETVKEDIDAGAPFETAAQNVNLSVARADTFRFNEYIPGIGNDVKFAAASLGLEPGMISRPVTGNNGVYIIKLLDKAPFNEEDYAKKHSQIANDLMNLKRRSAFNDWMTMLRNNADIEDYRDRFFR